MFGSGVGRNLEFLKKGIKCVFRVSFRGAVSIVERVEGVLGGKNRLGKDSGCIINEEDIRGGEKYVECV